MRVVERDEKVEGGMKSADLRIAGFACRERSAVETCVAASIYTTYLPDWTTHSSIAFLRSRDGRWYRRRRDALACGTDRARPLVMTVLSVKTMCEERRKLLRRVASIDFVLFDPEDEAVVCPNVSETVQ